MKTAELKKIDITDLTPVDLGHALPQRAGKISDETRIILPNSFTFSYKAERFTACQHDILLLIFERLQGFMTSGSPLDKELYREQ